MMGSICCFLSPIMDSPMSTMISCQSNASDGGSVMSSGLPQLRFGQFERPEYPYANEPKSNG